MISLSRFVCCLIVVLTVHAQSVASDAQKPNVIIIFTDDQGYQDLGSFGSPNIRTPHLDQMAKEGVRLTDFYVAANICTPSRSALLTGCYPKRVGLHKGVLFEFTHTGLDPSEITIAEVLRDVGYRTACIGKWHLGHQAPFHPINQGFESYFGIPYSNDMAADPNMKLAADAKFSDGFTAEKFAATSLQEFRKMYNNKVPLMRDLEVIEYPVDQRFITRRYTEEAQKFITTHKEEPFFLYLAHSMPHLPLYSPPERQGTSKAGPYGDVIEEIDWSAGQIFSTLKELGIDERTWVIFTSDNGPWLARQKPNSPKIVGSALPLRDGKTTTYDGGHRVPTVMRYPGKLPAGKVHRDVVVSFDLFPTIAALAGAKIPTDRIIDGVNCWDQLTGKLSGDTHDAYYYYASNGTLEGVRSGAWKLRKHQGRAKKSDDQDSAAAIELYNLRDDIGETHNLADANPQIVKQLESKMSTFDSQLESQARPIGTLTK